MFNSVRHKLPPVDYVSIVRSVYGDREALLFGAIAGALAAGLSAHKTDSIPLWIIAGTILVVGVFRYLNMRAFWAADIAADDTEAAQFWEYRATIGGAVVVIVYGIWCFVSLVYVDDAFAEMSSVALSIAAMVGVVARNFGLDRLVTLQSGLLCIFLGAGLLLGGDYYHSLLAALLLLLMVSFRKLARDTREILLNAVHGRVEASRLAGELDTAISTMPHGLCMLDEEHRVALVNKQSRLGLFGTNPERFVGRHFEEMIDESLRSGVLSRTVADYLSAEIRDGGQGKLIVGLVDGRQCEVTINSRSGHTVVMAEDITERVRAAERINFMARYDGLTQLSNRSFFAEQVQARLKEMSAADNHDQVMMMIIDIDDFKHVNDTLGHPVGDALLVEVSKRVGSVFEPGVMVARFGGDEFTVFRAGGATEIDATCGAEAVLAELCKPFKLRNEMVTVNASIGVVVADGAEATIDSLLTRADLALYRAKGDGKAQYRLFHSDMDVEYRQRQRLKTDLRGALAANEFYLLFQPIISLKTHKVVACEALVRWRHKELGVIPPMQFIPIAEEMGAMSEISRWVLEAAAQECTKWPEDISVSVNLSATDFRDADVEEMVANALRTSGLAPERLAVEITETTIIEELDAAVKALKAVREKGVGVALDDFGTGYSSLSYLHTLPFTKLKIDRSFVVDVTSSRRSRLLLANIARLAKDLDLSVVVEGIETENQLQVISETANLDLAQGYLFGAPLPSREITELIGRVLGSGTPPRAKSAAAG